jgi:hypothetical protein
MDGFLVVLLDCLLCEEYEYGLNGKRREWESRVYD